MLFNQQKKPKLRLLLIEKFIKDEENEQLNIVYVFVLLLKKNGNYKKILMWKYSQNLLNCQLKILSMSTETDLGWN